jgi:leucyl aminopeptidase
MKITASTAAIATLRTDCLVVPVFETRRLSSAAETADALMDKQLSRVVRSGDIDGKVGSAVVVHGDGAIRRVVLLGCGKPRGCKAADFKRAVQALVQAVGPLSCKDLVVDTTDLTVEGNDTAWRARTLSAALLRAQYRFQAMKSSPDAKPPSLRKVTINVAQRSELKATSAAIARASAISLGMNLAQDLGNLPANVCTPRYLAAQARKLGQSSNRLKVRVLTEKEIEKLGMGSFLSVAAGSDEPPRLITMEYSGGDAERRPVVLVGKGVTFDTGGISLKPGGAMDEMKFDMCGAASVFGTIAALDAMDAPVNVTGIVVATENMPSGSAVKPGDIVTTMAGKTVEILNTDAEGRLILCDALTYAERFEPDVIVDIATLTGACMVALGQVASGLFSNDDSLADELLAAGESTGDRAWRLPVWDEYQQQLSSNFADFANIGGRFAGAVTAACFLERFARDQRWAHLDIAGTAWKSGGDKGSTGRPVPLLTEFVLEHGAGRKRAGARTRSK